MTAQTTEAVQTAASVDEAFWDLILSDPELAAAEFAALTDPPACPPPDRLPPADGSPAPGHGRLCGPAARLDRPRIGASRTVPARAGQGSQPAAPGEPADRGCGPEAAMTREPVRPPDPYQVLGIESGAGPAEVTRAYRALARTWHPDANPSPDAPERLARVVDAYRRLIREDAPRADLRPAPAHQPPAPPPASPRRPRGATVVAGPVRFHGLPRT